MTDTQHRLREEIKAAEILRAQLVEIAGDDPDLLRDTLEGETQLHELIDATLAQISADAAHIEGLKGHMETLGKRKKRLEERAGLCRAAILTAMQTADLKTKETPFGTVTRKFLPGSLQVTDEAAIPAEFWKAQEPVLDKKALTAALKDNREVAGAALSNGGETVQIRWS